MLWHKCATSAECKSIRIAVSTVTDGWKGHTVSGVRFLEKIGGINVEFVTGLKYNKCCGNDTNFPT